MKIEKVKKFGGEYHLALGFNRNPATGSRGMLKEFAEKMSSKYFGNKVYRVDKMYNPGVKGDHTGKIAYYMATADTIDFNLNGATLEDILKHTSESTLYEFDRPSGVAMTEWEMNRAFWIESDKTMWYRPTQADAQELSGEWTKAGYPDDAARVVSETQDPISAPHSPGSQGRQVY